MVVEKPKQVVKNQNEHQGGKNLQKRNQAYRLMMDFGRSDLADLLSH